MVDEILCGSRINAMKILVLVEKSLAAPASKCMSLCFFIKFIGTILPVF